jgi:hypothetical protein
LAELIVIAMEFMAYIFKSVIDNIF